MKARDLATDLDDQDRQWGRAAARYDELFLDAFHPGVESPLMAWKSVPAAIATDSSLRKARISASWRPRYPE